MKYRPHSYRLCTLFLVVLCSQQANAACIASPTGNTVVVELDQPLSIGKITALNNGDSASISINADGTRAIPSTIFVGDRNRTNFGDNYTSGIISLIGSPDCHFKLNVINISAPNIISNVTLLGINGTALSSSNSGATGQFSTGGTANVQIGATISIDSTMSGEISESIQIFAEPILPPK